MVKPKVLADKIKKALPGTPDEIAEKIDASSGYVRQQLAILGSDGEAHICNLRGEPGLPCTNRWAAGPPGPDAPPQPNFMKRKARNRKSETASPPGKIVTQQTIEKMREQPANWLSALGQ